MRNYLFRNPQFFSWIYSHSVWNLKDELQAIYLTFDDGPTPEVTEYVLDQLNQYDAQATFFCVGENIEKNPSIIDRINSQGSTIGNHTFDHERGIKSSKTDYLKSVERCNLALGNLGISSRLFRPPYGSLSLTQHKEITQNGYRVIFWSHLSGDFDHKLNIEESLKSLKKAKAGSVLLFHDSLNAFANLRVLLPEVLKHFSSLGFTFKKIPNHVH